MQKLFRNYIDKLALGISFICLLHCIITPVLMILAVSVGFWKDLHLLFSIIIVPVTLFAVYFGYKHHGNHKYTALLLAGATLIVLAHPIASLFSVGYHTMVDLSVTTAGSLILVRGHYLNNRKSLSCLRGLCKAPKCELK